MNQPHERPPTSMRILMVTPNLPPITCGVADHTIKLGRAMIQQGAQVVVLGKHWRDPSPDMPKEFQAFLRWDGSIGSLMKIVSEGDFHWIWLQITPYAFSPRFGAPAKLILGLYRIRRRHPTLRIATCIHETHYLPEWLGKFKHIISFLQETAFTVLTGLSDLVIPSARLWEEYCRVCYHVPEDRNRYLPIAANIPHLQPDPGTRARMRQEWGLQPNQKAAIAFGLWRSQMAALQRLQPSLTRALQDGTLARIILVGGGQEPRPEAMDRILDEFPWKNKVTVLGPQAEDQIAKTIAACDVGLVPTSHRFWEKSGAALAFVQAGLTLWVFDEKQEIRIESGKNFQPLSWSELATKALAWMHELKG